MNDARMRFFGYLTAAAVILLLGCGSESADPPKVSAQSYIGRWELDPNGISRIFADSFSSAFITGRSMKYQSQKGWSESKAKKQAELDLKSEYPEGADIPIRSDVPVLLLDESHKFTLVSDNGELLEGEWQLIESGELELKAKDAENPVTLNLDKSQRFLEHSNGDLDLPGFGLLSSHGFIRRR